MPLSNFEQNAFTPLHYRRRKRWTMVWLKVFAKYIGTAAATEPELYGQALHRVCPEREPERREQTVLGTRRWRDPGDKVSCPGPDGR
jgi:hypothetical protein